METLACCLRSCPQQHELPERAILDRKVSRDNNRGLEAATSREELERSTIAKMKTVTGADESICIAMLQRHGYDVEESIEAFLEKM